MSRLGLLKHRNFAALWFAQAVSLLGDRFTQVATTVLAAKISGGSAFVFAFVWAAPLVPPILLSWAAGVLVDRWDKRKVMVTADIARGLLILSLVFIRSPLGLFVVSFGVAVFTAFFYPALMGTVPRTVPEKDLLAANSLTEATNSLLDIAGTAVAAMFVGLLGTGFAFTLDFLSYLASAVAIATITVQTRPEPQALEAGFWSDLRDGIHYHRENPAVFDHLILIVALTLGIGIYNTLTPLTVGRMLHRPTSDWGWLMAAQSLMMTLSAAWMGKYGARYNRLGLLVGGFAAMAVPTVGLAYSTSFLLSLALFAWAGAANAVMLIATMTWVQEIVAREMLGRVFSVRRMLGSVSVLVTTLLGGYYADRVGLAPALIVSAAIFLGAALLGLAMPSLRASSLALAAPAVETAAAEGGSAG